jgi:peptide/nickel transport system substrate-binding protein
MKLTKSLAAVAVAAVVAAGLSACSSGGSEIVAGSTVNIAWNQDFYSVNGQTSNGNATANNNILYMANSWFNDDDDKQTLIKNDKFGKYELVSQDPLTVKYTIADGVKWSDGTPVDAADLLLDWAANSCLFNNVSPEYDAQGNIKNQAALDAGAFLLRLTVAPTSQASPRPQ